LNLRTSARARRAIWTPRRDRIRKGASHYFAQLKELSLDASGVAELVRDYLPVIEAFEPTYIEEMHGIAEGAGVPFEDIVLLNARTEILKLAKPEIRARLKTPDEPDGCTGVVVLPQASGAGRLIHAPELGTGSANAPRPPWC